MGFVVENSCDSIVVELTGWDRVMNLRSIVEFDLRTVNSAHVDKREVLEAAIDHRTKGFGTHNGSKRPNVRRVGTMLGRAVAGKQFWAVESGEPDVDLLVLDLNHFEFSRAVLMTEDPSRLAEAVRLSIEP